MFLNVNLGNLQNVLQRNLRTDRAREYIFIASGGRYFRGFDVHTGLPIKTSGYVTDNIIKRQLPLACFEAALQYFVYQYPSRANSISASILQQKYQKVYKNAFKINVLVLL